MIKGQSNISNSKSDLHNGKNKNDTIVPSIKITNKNNSHYNSLSENVVFKDTNVEIDMNEKVKKEISPDYGAFNSERLCSFVEFSDDKRLLLDSKNTIPSINKKKNTGKSCEVEFNAEIEQHDTIDNELVPECPLFKLLDDEAMGELIQGMTDTGKIYHSKLEEILKDSLTFEEFEKQVEENISQLMCKEIDKQLKSCTNNFIRRTNSVLQKKYDSMKLQIHHINTLVDRHGKDLTTNANAAPQKLFRDMSVQTMTFENKKNELDLLESIIPQPQQITIDNNGVVFDAIKSNQIHIKKGIEKKTQNKGPDTLFDIPKNGHIGAKKKLQPASTLMILDENSTEIAKSTPIKTPQKTPIKNVNLVSPEPSESINEANVNVPVQHNYPAPLPSIQNKMSLPSSKLLPPAPKLKISNNQTPKFIELIWDMETNGIEEIKSFELYYCTEDYPDINTSVDTWQKIGDIAFLPLPAQCRLLKGTRNIKCHYKIRAVDIHGHVGPFSLPKSVFIN